MLRTNLSSAHLYLSRICHMGVFGIGGTAGVRVLRKGGFPADDPEGFCFFRGSEVPVTLIPFKVTASSLWDFNFFDGYHFSPKLMLTTSPNLAGPSESEGGFPYPSSWISSKTGFPETRAVESPRFTSVRDATFPTSKSRLSNSMSKSMSRGCEGRCLHLGTLAENKNRHNSQDFEYAKHAKKNPIANKRS